MSADAYLFASRLVLVHRMCLMSSGIKRLGANVGSGGEIVALVVAGVIGLGWLQ